MTLKLTELANTYMSDKGDRFEDYHLFTELYEKYFSAIKESANSIFEIGIGVDTERTRRAASLLMWRDYFENATIHGIDIGEYSSFNSDRIKTYQGSQADEGFLNSIFKDTTFDVIIDDGGHNVIYQQNSLGFLFKRVRPGGYYVVEDMHTSFMGPDWGGLPSDHPDNCYNVLKRFKETGKINTPYISEEASRFIEENTESIEIYDTKNKLQDIVAFIKRK